MKNKKLKLIMTNLAAGHITKKQADEMLKKKEKPNNKINKKEDKIKSHKHI